MTAGVARRSPCWQALLATGLAWQALAVPGSFQAEGLHQLLGRLIWSSVSGHLLGAQKRPISMVITMVLHSLDDAVLLVGCKINT